jgi:hypothetical protein
LCRDTAGFEVRGKQAKYHCDHVGRRLIHSVGTTSVLPKRSFRKTPQSSCKVGFEEDSSMSSDGEFSKGYFSTGSQGSFDAEQGRQARLRDDRAEAQRQEHARSVKESDAFYARAARDNQALVKGLLPPKSEYRGTDATSAHSGTPATFTGTVKGMALVGGLAGLAYAYFALQLTHWASFGLWAIKGTLVGAAAGVALYLSIVVLRVVFAIVAVIVKIALWAGLIFGGLYLVTRVL